MKYDNGSYTDNQFYDPIFGFKIPEGFFNAPVKTLPPRFGELAAGYAGNAEDVAPSFRQKPQSKTPFVRRMMHCDRG